MQTVSLPYRTVTNHHHHHRRRRRRVHEVLGVFPVP